MSLKQGNVKVKTLKVENSPQRSPPPLSPWSPPQGCWAGSPCVHLQGLSCTQGWVDLSCVQGWVDLSCMQGWAGLSCVHVENWQASLVWKAGRIPLCAWLAGFLCVPGWQVGSLALAQGLPALANQYLTHP